MATNNPNDPATYGLNLPTAMVIAAFCGIAWFNTVELQARIWLSFKRYSGLYFWSLVLSSWGCALHALSFIFLDFHVIQQANAVGVMIGISWWWMVTGQALVLYSRLHLVVRDKRKIRWVLIMIITNFWILHIPIMITSQLAYSPVPNESKWLDVYNVYEKVQMTGFTIQETIISGLYLYEARKVLRPGQVFQKRKVNQVIKHLIWVNIFIIFLDAALLSTEFANLFSIQTVFKAAVYSIKLRFELIVLNQLMDIVGARTGVFSLGDSESTGPGGHDSSRQQHNHSHQLRSLSGRQYQQPGNNYSAFASPGKNSAVDETKMDGVLRTTEVHIHGASELTSNGGQADRSHTDRPRSIQPEARRGEVITTHPRGYLRSPSPTSSEVEFAAKGADPY